MKKLFSVLSGILLVTVLILAGCAAPVPTPVPAPAPSAAPAPVASPAPTAAPTPVAVPKPASTAVSKPSEVFTLRVSMQLPRNSETVVDGIAPFFNDIEKATNGRVKVELYCSSTLAKGQDEWEAVKSGIAGSALAVHGTWPGMTPMADVISLPFIPFKNAEHASGILWKLYEQYPSFREQFKDNKILLMWTTEPYFLINSKKEVKKLDDFKGMKLRVLGGPPTEQIKRLGAVPIMLNMGDTYLNLQKGVIDGMPCAGSSIVSYRLYEVAKYYSWAAFHLAYFSLPINWDLWNRMPTDIQEILTRTCGFEGSKRWGRIWDSVRGHAIEYVKKGGFPMVEYTVPPDEFEKWIDAAGKPVWDDWIKKTEAQRYSQAREVLNTTMELVKTWNP